MLNSIAGQPGRFALDRRVFHSFVLVTGIGFAVAAVFCVLQRMHPALIVLCTGIAAFYLTVYYFSRFRGLYRTLFLPCLGLGLATLALLYFVSGGLEGSVPLVFLCGAVLLIAVLDSRFDIYAAAFLAGLFLLVYALEQFFPWLVIPYPGEETRRADIVFTTLIGLAVISVIISLLRQNYEAERSALHETNERLRESEHSLRRARDAAESASRARAEFLSTMSHEIRTPMNSVVGMTHLLLEENPRPDQLENLGLLRTAAENLLTLLNDVLDFSKLEAGRVHFENTVFSLQKLLSDQCAALLPRARQKELYLNLNLGDDLPVAVRGDATRLGQVLSNLISNAVKFTEEGGVTVLVESIEAEPDEGFIVLFRVRDTGIGIPADKLEFIFQKFTQASSETTRRYGGTGLGLAISKRLVELMGGDIRVTSVEGAGSEFSFRLGFARPPANSLEPPEMRRKTIVDLTGLRALLVEDFEPNVVLASKFLARWGIVVDTAANGVEALEKVAVAEYDLVLMDLQMPVMDGFEATRRIRALAGPAASLPILALTAAALPEEQERALRAGMNDFITKPFDPVVLQEKIAELTRRKIALRVSGPA